MKLKKLVLLLVMIIVISGMTMVQGKTTITFMTPLSGADGGYMDQIIQKFNKQNPDIEVTHLVVGDSVEYKQKLSTGLSTKSAPHVLLIRKFDMPLYLDQLKGFTTAELKDYGIDINDVYPNLMDGLVKDGKNLGIPLDVSTAAVAASFVATQEDNLIFNGNSELGHEGIFTAMGRLTIPIGNWEESGSALSDAVKATGALAAAGHYGPYAMVVSPVLFGNMVRVYGNTGMLELEQVKALITGGVHYSNIITGKRAAVISLGQQNLNLAIGQDMATGYTGPSNMNHLFRVMETLALLIRRPDAICTIE